MNYQELVNSPIIYILGGLLILIIIVQCLVFIKKAWHRGKELGISTEVMKSTLKSSAVFSIVPSIPIVIGLIAMVTVLGIPFPWVRVSIIGSFQYEMVAAKAGIEAMGAVWGEASSKTPEVFVNAMFVMSIGIIWGLLTSIFFMKKLQSGIANASKKNSQLSAIIISALFFGMISVFIGRPVQEGGVGLLTLLTSAAFMVGLSYMAKKFKWERFNDFALSISMIAAMALAILYTYLLGGSL